jgi:hypothetical protein
MVDVSIHPRTGRGGGKINTCAPKSTKRIDKAIAGYERHIEANPHDSKAALRLSTLKGRR